MPRFAWKATHNGAITRWSQQLCARSRRERLISLRPDFWALTAPGLPPFHRSCAKPIGATRCPRSCSRDAHPCDRRRAERRIEAAQVWSPMRYEPNEKALSRTGPDVGVLSAGRTVGCAPSEARCSLPNVRAITRRTTNRRLGPADQQPQRRVVRALLLTCGQRSRVDRPKPRPTAGIDDCDHDLQAAGCVEHNPVEHGTTAGDAHEVTYEDALHDLSVSRLNRAPSEQRSRSSSLRCETSWPVLWPDHRRATQTAVRSTGPGKGSRRRSARQRGAATSRCPCVGPRRPARRARARTVSGRTLRFASHRLARRPPSHRRFHRRRAMGEVRATSCTDGR